LKYKKVDAALVRSEGEVKTITKTNWLNEKKKNLRKGGGKVTRLKKSRALVRRGGTITTTVQTFRKQNKPLKRYIGVKKWTSDVSPGPQMGAFEERLQYYDGEYPTNSESRIQESMY